MPTVVAPDLPDGAAIHSLRIRIGLTQQSFAAMLFLATPTVSRWEHDHRTPTDGYSEVVLRLLGRINTAILPARQVVQTLRGAADRTDLVMRLVRLVDQSESEAVPMP